MKKIAKPQSGQFPEWASHYIDQLPDDGLILDHLQDGFQLLKAYCTPKSDEQLLHRYAEGKWSIKEVLVHLMDAERVFTTRALAAARGDKTELPSFDHNAYVPASQADMRTKEDLLAEYEALRHATIAFFRHLPEDTLSEVGTASGNPCTARAMAYMIGGHERHHLSILVSRYE